MKVTFKKFKGEIIAMLDHIKGAYATQCYAHFATKKQLSESFTIG